MRNKSSGNATVSVASYQNDPLYPRIVCAVAVLLEKGKVVAPVDVLAGMGLVWGFCCQGLNFGSAVFLFLQFAARERVCSIAACLYGGRLTHTPMHRAS